ncbi:exosome complex protein Rrp42 [Candidatus Woesearchaeota archaeon]|nr:exosome complex protein Rrp42 [Candidatus Woesearchaeota archaeon]
MSNKETIVALAAQQKRLDQRGLLEYRKPIVIETDISWTAEGSARVQIGSTVVLAGVKLSIEKPYNDTPDEGGITVNVELLPLSSPKYESGPPGMAAIELARVVDRGIREAKAIDVKKLCITPGEKAWFVIIDVVTVNDAGNLFDAAGLAALAALNSARFPMVNKETGVIDYKHKTTTPLPLVKQPLPLTVYKINGQLMVDLSTNEEIAYDARLTVASDKDGTISALQKGGSEPLTVEEIDAMMTIALEKARFLREELQKQLK